MLRLSDRVANLLPNLTCNPCIIGAEGVSEASEGAVIVSQGRVGPRGLEDLRDELSGRDLAIIRQVADLHLMSGRQVEAVFFLPEDHQSALSAARAARRALERLTRDGLLVRLRRRQGGVRAGSGSWIYGLGPVGHRVLSLDGARPRYYRQPSAMFTEHTLATSELVVQLTRATRSGHGQLLGLEAEPRCWRRFSGATGRLTLKPDLFVALGVGDYEDRFFVEIDRSTEHLPTVVRKCRLYDLYYQSGIEQHRHGVFPKVCLVVPNPERADRLRRVIDHARHLEASLFVVSTADTAMDALLGGQA